MSLADVRFLFERMRGLFHRGMTSLRTRGWQATWLRVRRHWARAPQLPSRPLYQPAGAPFAPFSVPRAEAPAASIVIPVYNQAHHTLTCLRSLAEHPPACGVEILVVDDGSSDETRGWMEHIAGLHYHRRASNGGFIAACNDGAARARGDLLVFLNNDTVPQPGWLDELVRTFGEHPDAGLVGAQLIYPDGRLQEAGGVVFSDGSAWNYGRFDAPEDPRYASLRDADYCSGAALAVPASLFRQLGGFDTRYAPAYYEDTDLAFAVRAMGRRVLYQPRSRVVHLEGISSGTDTSSGTKAYQVRNRHVFAEKWRDVLSTRHLSPDQLPTPTLLARGKPQILLLDAAIPQPDRDSGSLRLVNLMRMLIAEGAHVVFVPTEPTDTGRGLERLRALGVETWIEPFIGGLPAWLKQHGHRFDSVMASRHHVAAAALPLVRRHAAHARFLFDTVDLHFLRESRAAELAGDSALVRAAAGTRQRELDLMARSDLTLVVSAMELQLLKDLAPDVPVGLLSNLHEPLASAPGGEQREDLVFVGGFRHPPNIDAVRWFVKDVFPLIRTRIPGIRFHCIGSDPPREIQALHDHDGVYIHGYVEDLDPYMNGARVAVAPLRFGAGVKGKINLSMAHGQPVVATTCAAEGMHLRNGHDVMVADDAAGFAGAVVRAYLEPALWQRLSANGLENVRRHFSLDAARDAVREIFRLPQR